ncbi:MAG TPA: hypothetical protein VKM72_07690 [Thermoanaerobaculia bacterium]|nr:hypothetical protein [Thermoanaerobaculia bacterium]
MKVRMRVCVLALVLALSVVVLPAQAWTDRNDGSTPATAPSWWDSMLDSLASFFGWEGVDGSCMIDPAGCPEHQETLQGDNSCMIDPLGGCGPRS